MTPLRVESLPDGRHWQLVEPLEFYSADLRGVVVAPAGLVTGFASVPRGLWNLLPPSGKYTRGAVLHDSAYGGELHTDTGVRIKLIRLLADKLFLEGCRADGVSGVVCALLWRGVRLFGGRAYRG